MRDALARAITEAARQRSDVVLVVADISPAAALKTFLDENPTRIVDVGVSEQAMIGMAAGLAMTGLRPFTYTIAPFALYRPLEQIRVDLAYQDLPVVVVGVGAGLSYSALGATHHTIEDVAIASAIPNITVVAPCDPAETQAAVDASFGLTGPMYLRLGKSGEPDLTVDAPEPFVLGRIRCLAQGSGTAVIGYGPLLDMAFQAADLASAPRPSIYSAHTIKPLDVERVDRILRDYDHVIVLEEHVENGGLGMRVRARAQQVGASDTAITAFHLPDRFLHTYGSKDDLIGPEGISVEELAAAIRRDVRHGR
ncbi:MAG: transketolase C-terminal domain-containing protein [Actinomycetota bacterium]|nr:transketolase C-terminal domain-containing protein [Actinomycetota bacterium]